ncbi:MAG TPA: 50S ribosomal protein L9 [Amoebophilaceae bacterium]|jgi:large subunit ribosomal protein L9|nr:50S ribosomal protein L9 [Amoebophilaceae bacterium]
MEVLLQAECPSLGHKGDIVAVKPGYARNYLIPKGLAVVADQGIKKVVVENAKQAASKAIKQKADAQALLDTLVACNLVLKAKVGEGGRIFGSVTPLQLSKVLKEQGIVVDYMCITLDAPIKTIGTYQATVTLHEEVACTLRFDVVPL